MRLDLCPQSPLRFCNWKRNIFLLNLEWMCILFVSVYFFAQHFTKLAKTGWEITDIIFMKVKTKSLQEHYFILPNIGFKHNFALPNILFKHYVILPNICFKHYFILGNSRKHYWGSIQRGGHCIQARQLFQAVYNMKAFLNINNFYNIKFFFNIKVAHKMISTKFHRIVSSLSLWGEIEK